MEQAISFLKGILSHEYFIFIILGLVVLYIFVMSMRTIIANTPSAAAVVLFFLSFLLIVASAGLLILSNFSYTELALLLSVLGVAGILWGLFLIRRVNAPRKLSTTLTQLPWEITVQVDWLAPPPRRFPG